MDVDSLAAPLRPTVMRFGALVVSVFVSLLSMVLVSEAGAVAPRPDFFGVTASEQLGTAGNAVELERLGVHNVRNNITWNDFQPADCAGNATGPVSFAAYDKKVRFAAEHSITIIGDLYGTLIPPGCGTLSLEFPSRTRAMYNDYVRQPGGFVWQVVQRYGFKGSFWSDNPTVPYHPIRVWEVWNEQNLPVNNPGGNTVQPGNYATFLIDTAAAIRNAQKQLQSLATTDTKVLMGGLAPFQNGMYVTQYLTSIYSNPNGTPNAFHDAFDGLSYHPYALTGTAAAAEQGIKDARAALDHPRSALGGGSDVAKTLWITELGWPVGTFTNLPTISEAQQNQYIADAFSWIYSNADAYKIKYAGVYLYRDRAGGGGGCCWDDYAGLKRLDGSPRPSWCTYMGLIGVNSCQATPPVMAVILPDGSAYAKISNLQGAWVGGTPVGVKASAVSVAADPKNGLVEAVLGTNNHAYVRIGPDGDQVGTFGPWIDEIGPVQSVKVATDSVNGPLIGVMTNDNHVLVKQGNLNGPWVDEIGPVKSFSLATDPVNGPLIGVMTNDNHALVKQGNLNGQWVDEIGPVKSLTLASDSVHGALIGVMTNDNHALVKQGSLFGQWVDEIGPVKSLTLASDPTNGALIGVMTNDNHALVKQGSLFGQWVDEIGPAQALGLGSSGANGALIGVLTNDQHLLVKQGNLAGPWIDEFGGIQTFAVAG